MAKSSKKALPCPLPKKYRSKASNPLSPSNLCKQTLPPPTVSQSKASKSSVSQCDAELLVVALENAKGASSTEVVKILRHYGWAIARRKKHLILEHSAYPQKLTLPRSPSDWRAVRNILAVIKGMLGLALE